MRNKEEGNMKRYPLKVTKQMVRKGYELKFKIKNCDWTRNKYECLSWVIYEAPSRSIFSWHFYHKFIEMLFKQLTLILKKKSVLWVIKLK